MRLEPTMVPRVRRLALTVLAASLAACGDGDPNVDPATVDRFAPSVSVRRAESPDSLFTFTVQASDNLGIKFVRTRLEGALTRALGDTVRTAITTYTRDFAVPVPRNVPAGSQVTVITQVEDGAGLVSSVDTTVMAVGGRQPGNVVITSPVTNTQAVRGRALILSISGTSTNKVRWIGYTVQSTQAVTVPPDSVGFSSPLQDSVARSLSFTIPATLNPGNISVIPFLVDSTGQRSAGAPVVLDILASGGTATIPQVTRFGITDRVEATDTAFVEAQDPVGIAFVGYDIVTPAGVRVARDSQAIAGQPISVPATLRLRLPNPTRGEAQRLVFRPFARNTTGRLSDTTAVGADTVLLVNGFTRSLPNGGEVADGYFHEPNGTLYLTNIARNQVEVFNFDSLNFRGKIDVGSRPWGITVFPATRGTSGDFRGGVQNRLIVANSGGTNLSFVNVNPDGTGSETERYLLPNLIVNKISLQGSNITRTIYDFSDRPQFVGATCNVACNEVIVAYSTTPTGGQSGTFANKGTVRWENITTRRSHLFFEHATFLRSGVGDTIEILRRRSGSYGVDEAILPYPIATNAPSTPASLARFQDGAQIVNLADLGFRDTTYVRNSASFRRAVFGEGGIARGSRVLTYDANGGLQPLTFSVYDSVTARNYTFNSLQSFYDVGVSPPGDVSDLIANAFSPVGGVAISADGELNGLRADSTYLFTARLRLYGLLQTTGGNTGFDFHPSLAPGADLSFALRDPTRELTFAASREPQLEIYSTRCFQRVGVIPIRDPIIGPLKTGVRAGRIVAVGATARGVVVLNLNPADYTATC